jgi:threonine dehydratase
MGGLYDRQSRTRKFARDFELTDPCAEISPMKSLRDAIRPTTIIRSSKLDEAYGMEIILASETFQHTGSFKFRAAYNVVSSIPNEHIITASSGNFGQALAYACRLVGKKCTVVMPDNAANVKVDAVALNGGRVELVDTTKVSREERVRQLCTENPDAYKASPYDDFLVIEGNATLGEELSSNIFDHVLVPIGGGGLVSGILTGLCNAGHHGEVIGAEPLLANDAARSLREGRLIRNDQEPQTIADGARTISLGINNWEVVRKGLKRICEVSDDSIRRATKELFDLANLKCEPTGALGLGALRENKEEFQGKTVCVVISGGNVDPGVYGELIR